MSPLLRLPAEIRNEIYTYIFTNAYNPADLSRQPQDPPAVHGSAALALVTCRQLRHETSALLIFDFRPYFVDHIVACAPLEDMGRIICNQISHIKMDSHVVFELIGWHICRKAKEGVDYLPKLKRLYLYGFPAARFSQVSVAKMLREILRRPGLEVGMELV